MKAKLVRAGLVAGIEAPDDQTEIKFVGRQPRRVWKLGGIVDAKVVKRPKRQVVALVRLGVAVPADDECAKACCMTSEEMEYAQERYELQYQRVQKGIKEKDFGLFNARIIDGYDEFGQYIPGPKWDEYQAALEEAGLDQQEPDTEDDDEEEEE